MRIRWRNELQAELITPNTLLPKFLFSLFIIIIIIIILIS
jgi:hypothetical protein